MKTPAIFTLVTLMLLGGSPSLAADCDPNEADDLNSRIETNFTLMDDSGAQDAAKRDRIDAWKRAFSEAGELHSGALENNDRANLTKACDMYRSILESQAALDE